MKTKLAVLFFFISSLTLYAQEDFLSTGYNSAIKITPATFAKSEFQLTYEKYFNNRKFSISLIPSIILKDNNDESKEGWQGMSQLRFYLSHLNKENGRTFLGMQNYGFYTGVYGLYMDQTEEFLRYYYIPETEQNVSGEFKKEISAIEGGALIGVQVDITKRILIDFYIGGGIRYSSVKDTFVESGLEEYRESYNVFDPEYKGVKPTAGLLIGFLF